MTETEKVHRTVHGEGRTTLPPALQDAEIVTYEYDEETGWTVKQAV